MSTQQPEAGEVWVNNDFKDPFVIIHSTSDTVLIVDEEWEPEQFKQNFTLYRHANGTLTGHNHESKKL